MQVTAQPSLAALARPARPLPAGVYNAGLVVAGAVFVALSAQAAIPTPWGIPFTMQTFAVLVVGAALGSKLGAASLLMYLIMGLGGLPVFANFHAGIAPLTMGYLLAFVPAAALTGLLAERGWDRGIVLTLAAMTLGTAVIFLGGLSWLYAVALLSADAPFAASGVPMIGLVPFLPGAALKIALAAGVLPAAWKIVGRSR